MAMEEDINLGKFGIEADSAIQQATNLKQVIEQLERSTKSLAKEFGKGNEVYVTQETLLRKTRKEYNALLRGINDVIDGQTSATNRQKEYTIALEVQAKTIKQARDQNKLLNKLRNDTNVTTAEGRTQLERLNDKLDENNQFIRENVDQYTQQKINIGNYSDSVQDAIEKTGLMGGSIQEITANFYSFISSAENSDAALKSMQAGFNGLVAAVRNGISAMVAFIATPVGAVMAAIGVAILAVVGAFKAMQASLQRTAEGQAKLNAITRIFTGIINGVLVVLEPLANFVADVIIHNFELMGAVILKTANIVEKALRALGFDETADQLRGVTEQITQTTQANTRLAESEAELNRQRRNAGKIRYSMEQQIEKLKQAVDDENLSIEERVKKSDEVIEKLKLQQQVEMDLARSQVELAQMRIEADGATAENLDALAQAEERVLAISVRVERQISEQLNRQRRLYKEREKDQKDQARQAEDAADKLIEEELRVMRAKLDIYQQEQEMIDENFQHTLDKAKETAAARIALARQVFDASDKTTEDVQAFSQALLEIENRWNSERIKNAVQTTGEARMLIEQELEFSEEVAEQRIELAREVFEASKKTEQDRLEYQRQVKDAEVQMMRERQEVMREISGQEVNTQALEEELALAESIRDSRIRIAKQTYEASEKTAEDTLALERMIARARREFQDERVDIFEEQIDMSQVREERLKEELQAIETAKDQKIAAAREELEASKQAAEDRARFERAATEAQKQAIEERNELMRNAGVGAQQQVELEVDISAAKEAMQERIQLARQEMQAAGETAEAIKQFEQEKIQAQEQFVARQAQLIEQNADQRIAAGERVMQRELEIAEHVRDRRIEIAEKAFEASDGNASDRLEMERAINEANIELARERIDIASQNAQREVEIYKQQIEERKNAYGQFTEEWLEEERQRLADAEQVEQDFLDQQYENNLINEAEYLDRKEELRDHYREREQEKEQRHQERMRADREELAVTEFELEMMRMEEQGATRFEMAMAQLQAEYQAKQNSLVQQLENEEISRELYNAKILQLEREKANAEEQIHDALWNAKLDMTKSVLGAITTVLGKESAVGKATAIAMALINTYQGITEALKMPFPASLAAAATVAATGFKAVKDIVNTKLPQGGGGGGQGTGAPQQLGSGIRGQNVNMSAMAASGNQAVQQDIEQGFRSQNLVNEMAEAVRSGSREGSSTGSQQGIRDLSGNREIQRNSAF